MAYSSRTYTPGSTTATFALTTSDGNPIGYIRESDIEVKVNGSVQAASAYSFSGTKTVEQPSGGNIVLNSGVTGTVILSRTTAIQDATVVYTAGSTLTSTDLNNADNQIRFGLQEFSDDYASLLGTGGNLTDLASFIGGSDSWVSNDAKAATTSAIDGQIDAKATAKVKDDIIATAPVSIADDTPSSGKITISVDAELTELATMPIATAQSLADLSDTEVQILDGCTRSTAQLNYVDATSSIQTQINNKQNLAPNLTHIAALSNSDGNIIVGDGAQFVTESGATARTSLGAQAQDADLDTLSGMQAGAATKLAALTATEIETLDGITADTSELNKLDGVTSTTAELNILDGVTATTAELNIMDGVTATTAEVNYVDGVTSNVQTQLDAKQPLDADLTTLAGMQGATASVLAGGTALTSTLTELNQLDGITLADTASLDTTSNTKVPTSKAVADHVSGAVTAVGGFVAIANDASFPATASMPASGVVVSITDADDVVINGSGVSTTGRTTDGTPATVTINGFPATMYGETLAAGVGLQVLSTGSSNTYTYHKLLAAETDVKALSDDINDFNSRYRTDDTGNQPSSNNDAGDLFFNQDSDKMYVRNGANNAWQEVTSVGDFKYLYLCPTGGSGAPSFPGASYDLRESSNTGTSASVTSAAQLLVSVNGVIQQANTGTSTTGLNGFVMEDSNSIKFAANLVATDFVFIIQIGSAVTLNAPANNTVSTDVLQNLAVTNGKIADDTITEAKLDVSNAPTNGQFLQAQSGEGGGLTWAAVPAGVGGDTGVQFNDNVTVRLGDGTYGEMLIFSDGTQGVLRSGTAAGEIHIQNNGSSIETMAKFIGDGAVELNHNNVKKLETTATGITVAGVVAATTLTGDGSALTGIASTTLDGCAYENDQTISAGTYSIAAGKGAHSVGPITNNGTVTVNGTWVIS